MKTANQPRAFHQLSARRIAKTSSVAVLFAPALWVGLATPAHAQYTLSQTPPVASVKQPAPNVILTLDDSGSMGGAKMTGLKASLKAQFGNGTPNSGKLPDDSIRLAWQAMWDNNPNGGGRVGTEQVRQNVLTAGSVNSIKQFSGTHRRSFDRFVDSLAASGLTPSHRMMSNVHSYMSTATGLSSPFAADPGVTELPLHACRRTYHIFMTDGDWNGETGKIGNVDGGFAYRATPAPSTEVRWGQSSPTVFNRFPDGIFYDTTSDQTRLYRDAFGGDLSGNNSNDFLGTLADWAFNNWITDYDTSIPNAVAPIYSIAGNETVVAPNGATTTLTSYWNPKNNPMSWQGVNQYTIGFGNGATSWSGAPIWNGTTDDNYGGDYSRMVNGQVFWRNPITTTSARTSELWHMALNGRGKFYPARDATALSRAFDDILNKILYDNSALITGVAATTSTLRTNALAFISGYDSTYWSGNVLGYAVSSAGTLSPTPTWSAAEQLDSLTSAQIQNRKVFTHNGTSGIAFNWLTTTGLNLTQQAQLGGGDVVMGQNRVKYLRGDRTFEPAMRTRSSRLGDIVNSEPWFVSAKPNSGLGQYPGYRSFATAAATRPPMVYVGANDGMLHGFNAQSDASGGVEQLAYVPQGVFSKLASLTDPTYSHQYLVDGKLFAADANLGDNATPNWKTLLISGLGNGGKGFFILDVTNPQTFDASNVLLDRTAGTDDDIGHFVSDVLRKDADASLADQVVRTNDGKWSFVSGNGPNSTNARPVLLIQALTTTTMPSGLTKIIPGTLGPTDTGDGNGLSTPRTIDLDGNGTVDLAYAGDLKGNVWRFDLRSNSPASWVAHKLYTAVGPGNVAQSITAAPMWKLHPKGGLMLMVGTGRNFAVSDPDDTAVQTIYGLWDVAARYKTTTQLQTPVAFAGRSRLVEQAKTGTAMLSVTTYLQSSRNAVTYAAGLATGPNPDLVPTATSDLGWFLDIPIAGHRVVSSPSTFDNNLIQVRTLLPTRGATGGNATCDSVIPVKRSESILYLLDMFSGAAPKYNAFGLGLPSDTNGMLMDTGFTKLFVDQGKKLLVISPPNELQPCTGPSCPAPTNPTSPVRNWPSRVPSASYVEY
jgi:type IV pilus assembly protein PilY1